MLRVKYPWSVVSPLRAKVASPCYHHSIARGYKSAPVLAAFKGVASKGDDNVFNDGFNSATLSQLRDPAHPLCEWTCNYYHKPVGVPSGMNFMPMVFGKDQFRNDGSNDRYKLKGGVYSDLLLYGRASHHILGFNEPDGGANGQANLSVADAVNYWHSVHYTARAAGAYLGSPAMGGVPRSDGNSLLDAASDNSWLDQFLNGLVSANLQGGTVDFICVHWYPADANAMPWAITETQKIDAAVTALTSFLERVHRKYGKPVWLTEFSLVIYGSDGRPTGTSPPDVQTAFLRKAAEKMNRMDFVHRYAWFCSPPWFNTNVKLFDGSQNLTDPLGKAFQEL